MPGIGIACIPWVLLLASLASCNKDDGNGEFERVDAELPELAGYMVQPDTMVGPANWLGRPTPDGRELYEPINMILVDAKAGSAEEARERLTNAFRAAGYGPRFGHSSGYWGLLGGRHYPQVPVETDMAFADYMWAFTNNHARVFGPYRSATLWVWVASSSTEKGIIHDYVSFNRSRDAMASGLVQRAGAVELGRKNLGNRIDNSSRHTGDHDGKAPILQLN